MRGSIRKRYRGSYSLILDLGHEPDPVTGRLKRKQKWVTYRGTKKGAERQLAELLTTANGGMFVEPSKLTLGAWLREWLDASVKPQCRPSTYDRYRGIIENNLLRAPLSGIPLQRVRPSHIKGYYAAANVSASTLMLHHTILHSALRSAVREKLVAVNVAADLDGRPRCERPDSEDARKHCWTADEARAFLVAAKAAGPRQAAFYALALDTGARKGEVTSRPATASSRVRPPDWPSN